MHVPLEKKDQPPNQLFLFQETRAPKKYKEEEKRTYRAQIPPNNKNKKSSNKNKTQQTLYVNKTLMVLEK